MGDIHMARHAITLRCPDCDARFQDDRDVFRMFVEVRQYWHRVHQHDFDPDGVLDPNYGDEWHMGTTYSGGDDFMQDAKVAQYHAEEGALIYTERVNR
jgi:hypothetical protein